MDMLRDQIDRWIRRGCLFYGLASLAAAAPLAGQPAEAVALTAFLLTLLAIGLAWKAWAAEGSAARMLDLFAAERRQGISHRQMRERLAQLLRESLVRHAEWTAIAAGLGWSLSLALRTA